MDFAVKLENIGKKYIIYHQNRERYKTLRDTITNKFKNFFKKKKHHPEKEEFWALKDINFEIKEGDKVGIIGRNGAGKSTLLKILSRITEPTTGKFTVKGRVASLLEVGTGFHPELTGRENIYLNGSILGMTRNEIKKKFDEIVAFSEVEKFLDTPVKRYSSGMYVRLAFSVAAHLEPEILIVDEVLAVGDASFQKKCLGKMGEIGEGGRTVLFVSHNMNAIDMLCKKCLLLESGKMKLFTEDINLAINNYLNSSINENKLIWVNLNNQYKNDYFIPQKISIVYENGNELKTTISNNSDFYLRIEGELLRQNEGLQIGYALYNSESQLLYWSCNTDVKFEEWETLKIGKNILFTKIPKRLLNEGQYRIELIIALYYKEWICEPGVKSPSITFEIFGGLSDSPYWMVKRPGILAPVIEWKGVGL